MRAPFSRLQSGEIWIWSWNVRMKSLAQLGDLVDSVTRHVSWDVSCLQEAAMEATTP